MPKIACNYVGTGGGGSGDDDDKANADTDADLDVLTVAYHRLLLHYLHVECRSYEDRMSWVVNQQ
jgi:hypothetical protein